MLTIAVAFIVLLAYLTIVDFVRHGITALGVLGALIVVFFSIGILGVLRHPPEQ